MNWTACSRDFSMIGPAIYAIIFFFFNDTATTEIYTLSLHDALPIYRRAAHGGAGVQPEPGAPTRGGAHDPRRVLSLRSEEHTSELQSQSNLVCRLLLEKKKRIIATAYNAVMIKLRYTASTSTRRTIV